MTMRADNDNARETHVGLAYRLRRVEARDHNFLAGTWLRSFASSPFASRVTQEVYSRWHPKVVNAVLVSGRGIVAEHAELPDCLLGYAIGRAVDGVAHVDYVYTKGDFRRLGIARECVLTLLRELGGGRVVFTHSKPPMTRHAFALGWQYDPYAALCLAPKAG